MPFSSQFYSTEGAWFVYPKFVRLSSGSARSTDDLHDDWCHTPCHNLCVCPSCFLICYIWIFVIVVYR
uniref:Uncharacterized protein n=1 Tax=Zea mays TaxID=4577 RepID=B4FJV5_MAIZE|nr:unknown [Zea mays]